MTLQSLKQAFRDYRPILLLSAAYAVLIMALCLFMGARLIEFTGIPVAIVMITLKSGICLLLLAFYIYLRGFFRPRMPPGAGWRERIRQGNARWDAYSQSYLNGDMLAYAAVTLLAYFCISFFFASKSLVPVLFPYTLDPLFAEWDRILHGGVYPHEWLVPLVGRVPVLITVFDRGYWMWFAMMYLIVAYNLFCDDDHHRRMTFTGTFVLSWVLLGSCMAWVLASVGPVFYHLYYPDAPDPYAGLVAHLEAGIDNTPVFYATRFLLLMWMDDKSALIKPNALSAMPSMHVAVAWLAVIYTWHIHKAACAAAGLFFLTILVGTVYLGFHYAVDGYVAVIGVSALWWGVGKLVDRRFPREAGKKLQKLPPPDSRIAGR